MRQLVREGKGWVEVRSAETGVNENGRRPHSVVLCRT